MALPAGRRKAANVTLLTSLVEGKTQAFLIKTLAFLIMYPKIVMNNIPSKFWKS